MEFRVLRFANFDTIGTHVDSFDQFASRVCLSTRTVPAMKILLKVSFTLGVCSISCHSDRAYSHCLYVPCITRERRFVH